jgi:hypothetical protein
MAITSLDCKRARPRTTRAGGPAISENDFSVNGLHHFDRRLMGLGRLERAEAKIASTDNSASSGAFLR